MNQNFCPVRCVQAGFTLVELAISVFIITLLLGTILIPLATQVEQRQINETQKLMDDIREALLGFAATNGYLPCPDLQQPGAPGVPNDGIEDVFPVGNVNAGRCIGVAADASVTGNLPWATLGLGSQDTWGNRFRYSVQAAYAQRPLQPPPPTVATFGLGTGGGLRVCAATTCPGTTTLTTTAVAVIISHGKNGLGAISASTNLFNPVATSADELNNATNDQDSISRTPSNVTGVVFDDIVIWLPKFILNSRMIAAGKLP
jgi:type II secretory pathway pseudopilin PulG